MASSQMLSYRDISYSYHTQAGETVALCHFSMDVREGEFISLLGPSGCGKSTILSLTAGLMLPDEGQILLDAEPIRKPSRRIGYMLQRDHLFGWRTILSNCLLGLQVRHEDTPENRERVMHLLEQCGLAEFAGAFPQQLSGGMRQRAALVRTLALQPDVLLLDEPFSALDSQTRVKLGDEVGTILRAQRCTALLVTHDISEAISMSDRVMVLSKRPATLKSQYEIELAGAPLERRNDPGFRSYFDLLWKELDVHVA